MKKGTIEFQYFEKGDYVRTGYGVGIVNEDEPEIKNVEDLRDGDVIIQHKNGNPGNHPVACDRNYVLRISEKEYNDD